MLPERFGELVFSLAIGLLAGFVAGQFTKGRGIGRSGNVIVGMLGAFSGAFVSGVLGLGATNPIPRLIGASIGAVLLLFLLSLATRKRV